MIDWDRVAQLRDELGPADFSEVVALFFEEVDEALGRLAAAKDLAGRRDDLHFLKGSALNLGFVGMGELCGRAERDATMSETHATGLSCIHASYAASREQLLRWLAPADVA